MSECASARVCECANVGDCDSWKQFSAPSKMLTCGISTPTWHKQIGDMTRRAVNAQLSRQYTPASGPDHLPKNRLEIRTANNENATLRAAT